MTATDTAASAAEEFSAYPFVCGRLGPADPEVWRRLTYAAPVPVTQVATGSGFMLAVSDPALLEKRRGARCWGRYVAGRAKPRTWEDAAHTLGLAGLWYDDRSALLHADVLGLQDIFYRQVGEAVYFCNRVAPLRSLSDQPLNTDWDAWGASLVFTGFVADATPFVEIRRLQFAEVFRVHGGAVTRERVLPDWLAHGGSSEPPAETDDVLAALRDSLPRKRRSQPSSITLSGGWDSRLIATGLAEQKISSPRAWTTWTDDGNDDDAEFGRTVAQALGFEHSMVRQRPNAWLRQRESHLTRMEHLTWLHTWLVPMAHKVRQAGLPLFDGLAGEFLLRHGRVLNPELYAIPDPHERLQRVWHNLGGGRLSLRDGLDPVLAERWTTTTFEGFRTSTDVWSGHRAEYLLRTLTTRTNRPIGSSPMRMFAPEIPVRVPLADPRFIRVALRIPNDRRDKDFFRALLNELDPTVASLPSTNDDLPKKPWSSWPSQMRPAARNYLQEQLDTDDVVRGMLHPDLLARLEKGERNLVHSGRLQLLHWATAFVHWRRTNAAYLTDAAPPWQS